MQCNYNECNTKERKIWHGSVPTLAAANYMSYQCSTANQIMHLVCEGPFYCQEISYTTNQNQNIACNGSEPCLVNRSE